MADKVLIIGAGVSGLAAIKACLEEGLHPVCFERYDHLGGLWKYSSKIRPGQGAGVYKGLITNISKEMMCFSDFPMPDHYTTFITSNQFYNYLESYCQRFDLLKHIRYNVNVLNVKKSDNYDETGQWTVTYQTSDGIVSDRIFDKVIVATGYFHQPKIPVLAGIETFPGEVLHSHAFRNPQDYNDKCVLVIGNGVSAGDISAMLGHTASKVLLSIGHGTWLIPKTSNGGVPFGFQLLNRASSNKQINTIMAEHLNSDRCGLTSERSFYHGLMITDDLKSRILCGAVKIKARIVSMKEKVAYFDDGTTETNIDTVLFATGFKQHYPFLGEDIMPDNYKDSSLYMNMWPTSVNHPSLALIGCCASLGLSVMIIELQARYAASVFSGQSKLPSKYVMLAEVKASKAEIFKRYGQYKCGTDGRTYPDKIAELIGCRPNIVRYLLTDPKVAMKLMFGPLFPVQYRMQGPHKWTKARELFLTAYNRTLYSTQTRKPPSIKKSYSVFKLGFFFACCLGALCSFIYTCMY